MLSDSRGQTFQVSNKTLPKKTEKKLPYWFQVAPFFQVNNFRENGKLFAMLSASPGQTTQKKNFSKNQKKTVFLIASLAFFFKWMFSRKRRIFCHAECQPKPITSRKRIFRKDQIKSPCCVQFPGIHLSQYFSRRPKTICPPIASPVYLIKTQISRGSKTVCHARPGIFLI